DVSYWVLWIRMRLASSGVQLLQPCQHTLDDTILGYPTRLIPVADVVESRRRDVHPRVDLLEGAQQLGGPRRIFRGPKLVQLNVSGNEAQAAKGINRDLPVQKPVEYVGVEHVGGHWPLTFFTASLASATA